jgi:hypothetical protein
MPSACAAALAASSASGSIETLTFRFTAMIVTVITCHRE